MNRRTAYLTIPVLALLALPPVALSSGGNDPEVRNAGRCDGSSTSKIKVKEDNGGLEVEFEVDQNRNGVPWKVKIKDNGKVAFDGRAVTKGPSGSFSIERRIGNSPGKDSVKGVARNPASGERCVATATL